MKILFVAMSESIHTVRWINQLNGLGWDLHLFPSIDGGYVHPLARNMTVYHSVYAEQADPALDASMTIKGKRIPAWGGPQKAKSRAKTLRSFLERRNPDYRAKQLADVIRKIQPDIIHSLEFQHGGYLALAAKGMIEMENPGSFPPWMITNWGNDIYLFGRLDAHRDRINLLLAHADYYTAECERDIRLGRESGFKGEFLPVLPNVGGFDLDVMAQYRATERPSERKTVVLKGYQHWAGRALCGLRAIELCADVMQDYRVAIYSAFPDVQIAAELLAKSTGIQVDIIPWGTSHEEMMRLLGRARIYMGLSISDGISISSLEALTLGTFPIQSRTACADEWFTDGESGFIVPPEDPQIIAEVLRRALTDDELVDRAAELNAQMAKERLDYNVVRPQAINYYRTVAEREGILRTLSFERKQPALPRDTSLPLVSILTPTYNRADFLRETIESVLGQTYPNIEYLVLDDGSKDNTQEILKEYEGQLRWESHPNMGETRTVNKGWHMLSGDYIMVVNSDDPILPNLVETAVAVMEANPDLLVVYPDWLVINEHNEVTKEFRAWDYDYEEMVRTSGCLVGPGALVRRKVLELEPERNTAYRYVADFEYWLRVGRHGPFQRLPQSLATHRTHGNSAGVSQGEALSRELITLMERYFQQPDLPQTIRRVRRDAISAAYYDIAKRHRANRRWKYQYGLKALAYHPRFRTKPSPFNPGKSRHPTFESVARLFWPGLFDLLRPVKRRLERLVRWADIKRRLHQLGARLWRFIRYDIWGFSLLQPIASVLRGIKRNIVRRRQLNNKGTSNE